MQRDTIIYVTDQRQKYLADMLGGEQTDCRNSGGIDYERVGNIVFPTPFSKLKLINSDIEGRDTGSFIGDSYRELTRIANINEDLWSELFLGNKDHLLKAINRFELELDLIKKAIYDNDAETLKQYFIKSTKRREKLG